MLCTMPSLSGWIKQDSIGVRIGTRAFRNHQSKRGKNMPRSISLQENLKPRCNHCTSAGSPELNKGAAQLPHSCIPLTYWSVQCETLPCLCVLNVNMHTPISQAPSPSRHSNKKIIRCPSKWFLLLASQYAKV